MATKAIKFTLVGHVILKNDSAGALQEAANKVLEIQAKIDGTEGAKISEIKTSVGVIKP